MAVSSPGRDIDTDTEGPARLSGESRELRR
jgi:hypothetical protein